MSRFEAIYFDGNVATSRPVQVSADAGGLAITGTNVAPQIWRFADLKAVDPPAAGAPLRLSCAKMPGARLIVASDAAKAELLGLAPHLKGGLALARVLRFTAWTAVGLAAVAAVAYAVVQLMPQSLAFMVPDTWRERVGEQIEASLVEGAKRCSTPEAGKALSAMMARLTEGNPDLPSVAVHFYDIPVMNAFAMPGGRIVMTSELIKKAEAPEEVAGVLAHELGHVMHRHSETQIIRAAGLQLLFAMVTSGGGGDTLSKLAGLATILRYSRQAESEADEFAQHILDSAEIDPLGLKHFFERVLEEEKKLPSSGATIGKIEGVFATHPGTAERIEKITPLPEGVTPRPVMTSAQWEAFRAICGG